MKSHNRNNWALLTTNYGRTAVRVLELYAEKKLPKEVNIKLVIFQNTPSGAAECAEKLGIKTIQVNRQEYSNRKDFEDKLLDVMKDNEIDYIFLLAFSYLLKNSLLEEYQNRIVNIHPSLLPSFRGHKAIQQAMDYGVAYSGMTTHFIDGEVDMGKIIAQLPIPFYKKDSFEDIDSRYMANADQILIETFEKITYG